MKLKAALLGAVGVAICACTTDGEGGQGTAAALVDYRRATAAPAKACDALAGFAADDVTIRSAVEKAATETTPAHCEVLGVVAPAITFRVQLPDGWNGRFYLAGNGGLAGEPVENRGGPGGDPTAEALRRGFATAITDTGHDNRTVTGASFATDPQVLEDYAYRAIHETAVVGKALALDYYDAPRIETSYYQGCSTGGRQGLISAQRFPEDFDGVIAGAPISDYTGTLITTMWTTDRAERAALTPAQFVQLADAYDAKCDALDGLADGLVSNTASCRFTPSEELPVCAASGEAGCFSAEQLTLLDEIVAGPSVDGRSLHPGLTVETARALDPATAAWTPWWVAPPGGTPLSLAIHGSSWAYMVLDPPDPDWDWRAFDFERDPPRLAALSALIDATDPNLDAFRARSGKLLMYHGTADPGLVFGMSVDYRNAVSERYGVETSEFYRLYAMPGMYHCRGGYGPDRVDTLDAMVQWVEAGRAPELVASQVNAAGEQVRSRPLCDYPAYARYVGGDPNDAASFSCETP